MMRKIILLIFLFTANLVFSQIDYSKVLNLLISNEREEARKLFDTQFGKIKDTNIDLLFLDGFIDMEMGQTDFDGSIISSLEKLPNSQYYIPIFANSNMVLGNITKEPGNDLTYKRIDLLAALPKFKDISIVKYRKAIVDRKRFEFENANRLFKELGAIEQWQFCGVFENLNGSGLEIDYEPESYPKADRIFDANSNGKIGWYIPKKAQTGGYHVFSNEGQFGTGIIYAQTFIDSPEKKNYILSFGANSGLKIFLNDKEIYINQEINYTNLDAYQISLPLEKGNNRLLFKLEIHSDRDYFSAQVKNSDKSIAKELKFNAVFQEYPIASTDFMAPEIKADFEKYFDDLVKNNPDNILYRLYQFAAYEVNNKKADALESIDGLNAKYPNSSLIGSYFLRYYDMLEDGMEKRNEVMKNIENNDGEYYLIVFTKLTEVDWLKSTSVQELEKYRDISKKYKQRFAEQMYDFMLISRKVDVDGMIKKLDEIIADSHNNEKMQVLAATMYLRLKNDKSKTVSILEGITSKIDNYEADDLLLSYYNDMNKKVDVERIVRKRIEQHNFMNAFRNDYIQILINENQYEKALSLVDENLSYFPYSFTDYSKKATIYSLMNNDKEAEKNIRKSLAYNSENDNLRKTLYDITKTPDEIKEVQTKDIYKVIRESRKSKMESNYGVVVLLDEFIVNVLPEGGYKSKFVCLYEITSENGIEEMKEYSLDTRRNTLLKSEIVKSDGSLIPAEVGNNTLVFSNLKIGDVIYMEFEKYNNATGRFFKDFNINSFFNSSYPSVETIFTVISPPEIHYNTIFNNGSINPTVKKVNNKICTTWKRSNIPSLPLLESYGPVLNDLTSTIYVGTIKSWSDISNWYADLVRKNLKLDKVTKDTFNAIFPNGTVGMEQEAIAKKIYMYIEDNITYSSLDFRQSGYVPQKPSKTITTKLGDCKDVSTLFVALSQLAGLKSNLVLVSTNDNGLKTLPLPVNEFNHCIVVVNLDGKDIFLELTNKFLPFKSLPNSLYKANALVIPLEKGLKSAPISIPFDNAVRNTNTTISNIAITDESLTFINKQTIQGANKSYYNELFSESTTETVRKKELEKDYNSKLKKVVNLQSAKLISNIPGDSDISFETQFSIPEKPKVVGSLRITDMPFLDHIYTRDIISQETRKFDIDYSKYENCSEYHSVVFLNIPANKKFTEIPEDKTFAYKGHSYAMKFELVAPNSLKVVREGVTPWENIPAADYPEFKKYVENVIDTEEKIIGYN